MTPPRVLLIEDEPGLVLTLGDRLRAAGYAFEAATDGEQGVARALATPGVDLVLLDVMLRGIDGFEVCRRIRRDSVRVPILMLTARDQVGDRVAGLRLGADDYLTKPFAPEELLARIEALLRRAPAAREPVRFGDVEVDLRGMEVRRAGEPVELAALEYQLLCYLIERAGEVVSREEILRSVWGFQRPPRTRTVDVHVTWLRSKLETDRAHPTFIRTVRGAGYKFVPEGDGHGTAT